jgi:hypothetical protein
MANQRIFYACQAVAIAPRGTTPLTAAHVVHGLQSVGMTSTFTLEQVFEMGQIEIYENIEEVADIEVTLEKVIDGYKLIFDLATNGACKTDLVAASKARSDVYVAVFDDGLSNATGVPKNVCMNSGMFVSSVSYSYTVDGSATESVTLVGNDRFWNSTTAGVIGTAPNTTWANNITTNIDGTDTPKSGVVRRVNVDILGSVIPTEVSSQADAGNAVGLGSGMHVQSITVSTDFGQENIQELGRFGPYTRYATFPIEVTCEFEVIATVGDLTNVSGNAPNLTNRQIVIKDTAGTVLNLGTKNKLTSVSYSGGDTGGGNATITYSYSNFNVLTVNGGTVHS